MEKAVIVACPSCGALGKAGEPCEFCGATIVAKDDAATYEERIVSKRSINPMAFAQKVSVFKTVGEFIYNCAVVRMGSLCGVINLNGDFIFPLEYGDIVLYPEGYAYLRKESERIFFDLTKWKPLDLELLDRGAPDGLSREVVSDNCLLILNWKWYGYDDYCYANRVYFLDMNDQVVLWSDYSEKCKTGFISLFPASYIDIRSHQKYSLPCKEYYDPFLRVNRNVSFIIDKQGDVVVTLDYPHSDFYSVVNTEVEDIQAEINRACYEVLAKYKASLEPEKKSVGCIIAFLPFLTLGTGAIIGVLELIKHVIC